MHTQVTENLTKPAIAWKTLRLVIGVFLMFSLTANIGFAREHDRFHGFPHTTGSTDLRIGNYKLVAKRKVSSYLYDYTYRAIAHNTGSATAYWARAKATSLEPSIKIEDPYLKFGIIPSGKWALSRDTFTLRKPENISFEPNAIKWEFNQDISPTANAGPDQTVTIGSTVQLDGSASSNNDENGNKPLNYSWRFAKAARRLWPNQHQLNQALSPTRQAPTSSS